MSVFPELFTVTCVDQTSLGLFFKVATRDKYLILLTGSWVVVARDTTYAAIFMDWTILNRYVQIDPHQEDKVRIVRRSQWGHPRRSPRRSCHVAVTSHEHAATTRDAAR